MNKVELATFAAGCFWGIEHQFQQVKGVIETRVGYTGGHSENPSYHEVCRGDTGHAEAVQLQFDPEQVSYETLLDLFWHCHTPTQLNRQGPDIGHQYRSAIFYHTALQQKLATTSKDALNASNTFGEPIVTEILPATEFYEAEEYHQKYFDKHGGGHCKT